MHGSLCGANQVLTKWMRPPPESHILRLPVCVMCTPRLPHTSCTIDCATTHHAGAPPKIAEKVGWPSPAHAVPGTTPSLLLAAVAGGGACAMAVFVVMAMLCCFSACLPCSVPCFIHSLLVSKRSTGPQDRKSRRKQERTAKKLRRQKGSPHMADVKEQVQ